MIDLGKKLPRRAFDPDEQPPCEDDVLSWETWAAFCDFHEGIQAIHAQIEFTSGKEPSFETLWDFFITVIHRAPHHGHRGDGSALMWRPLAEWFQDDDLDQE